MASTTTSSLLYIQLPTQPAKTAAPPVTVTPPSPLLSSPYKRKTMSITQTYYLAHKARAKLSAEAQRPDHNLRKLVGSANLLDALMLDLADAEREQESWFNQSVRGATNKRRSQDRRVQWADAVVEEPEDDWEAEDAASDSDSDSDSEGEYDDLEDFEMADVVSMTRIYPTTPSAAPAPQQQQQRQPAEEEQDEYLDDEDEDEDYDGLSLTRLSSRSATSPPGLALDSDESDDESMPPSPPTDSLPSFSEKQPPEEQEAAAPAKAFYEDGYYLPPRNPARLVSAISVY